MPESLFDRGHNRMKVGNTVMCKKGKITKIFNITSIKNGKVDNKDKGYEPLKCFKKGYPGSWEKGDNEFFFHMYSENDVPYDSPNENNNENNNGNNDGNLDENEIDRFFERGKYEPSLRSIYKRVNESGGNNENDSGGRGGGRRTRRRKNKRGTRRR